MHQRYQRANISSMKKHYVRDEGNVVRFSYIPLFYFGIGDTLRAMQHLSRDGITVPVVYLPQLYWEGHAG
jgi:hypothetical protein